MATDVLRVVQEQSCNVDDKPSINTNWADHEGGLDE